MKRTLIAASIAALGVGAASAATTELIIYKQRDFQGAAQTVKGEVNVLEGGFTNEVSSIRAKGGFWEVCNQDRFKGDCRVLAAGDYPRLDAVLNDRIVSVRYLGNDPKLQQRVAKAEIKQERQEIREERRADRREDRREARDDRFRNSASLDLYGQPDFRGRSVRLNDNVANLGEVNFDGRASSVVVHDGTWQLCSEPNFRGQCGVFRPGEYSQIAGLDDRVSSARQLR